MVHFLTLYGFHLYCFRFLYPLQRVDGGLLLIVFVCGQCSKGNKDCIDMAREYLRRAHVLVVCGSTVDESVKNDIAVAERLRITATTLDGILTVKGQGRRNE